METGRILQVTNGKCPSCSAKIGVESFTYKNRNFTSSMEVVGCYSCNYCSLGSEKNRRKVFPENPRSEWTDTDTDTLRQLFH